jgi:hypothetical protein
LLAQRVDDFWPDFRNQTAGRQRGIEPGSPVQLDADLQLVIKAWDSLPQVVRHDIVALTKGVQPNG